MQDELIGKGLGQYEILEKVGQGGMAQVYKAYQSSLDRFVAVKILSPLLAANEGFTRRFKREARSVASLHHPNILQVYDFGVQDHYHYIAMRYVENSTSLADLIRDAAPKETLISHLIQVADALAYAHNHNIIHRDIKPSNILIDGRWAFLTDFGLVRIGESSSDLTQTGTSMGTPAYMAPEQAMGEMVDHRADIYALGVIFYQVLTGVVPHKSTTPRAILVKRSMEPVTSLRHINPAISPALERAVLRSLAMAPGDRYTSADQFATAIEQAQRQPNLDVPPEEGAATFAVIDRELTKDAAPANVSEDNVTITASSVAATNKAATEAATREESTPVDSAIDQATSTQTGNLKRLLPIGGGLLILLLIAVLAASQLFGGGPGDADNDPENNVNNNAISFGNATDTPTPTATAQAESATLAATNTPDESNTDIGLTLNNPAMLEVQTELLEVRATTCEDDAVQYFLSEGATVELIGRGSSGSWWQVRTSQGAGWVQGDASLIAVSGENNVPVLSIPPCATETAPASPSPTLTNTPQLVAGVPTSTSTATATASPTPAPAAPTPTGVVAPTATPTTPPAVATPTEVVTPTATATSPPAEPTPTEVVPPTATPAPPAGQFALLKPVPPDETTSGPTEFIWQWNTPLADNQGFEIRVWQEGAPPAGAHNAIEDNQQGNIANLGNGTYSLTVDITNAFGVQGAGGDYLWTVVLIEIEPEYRDLGIQAPPGRLRLDVGGGGGDGGDDGGGGGGFG